MDRRCFTILCHLLRTVAGLTSIEVVDVEEMVAMFLHIVAHDVKNRVIQREFMRSGETISRHFNMVLLVVIRLHDKLLKKPQPVNNDCTDQRWRWFEVPISLQLLLAGWEGSAADSRILHDAISRPNGLKVPKGYYYLVDAGYPNVDGFLAAYRGQRYHLQEWRGVENAPSTSKEFFNMKHSSARNTKEEEAGLVECLVELVNGGGWRSDNGTFHPGYLNQLARVMAFKILEKEVFDDWVKSHPAAKGLLNKSFVHYDELSYVFGKDRATEGRAESFANNGSNDLAGYDAFIADAAPDMDFPPMYSQGLNMSFDDLMGTRTARVSERRNISSGSKQKRLGHATDSGDIVRTAIECRLMRILMRNVDDMKAFLKVLDNMKYPYCSIILQENR
ncbi:retrotransposon protein [Cucumis melo var. makuwa]|uniref:Retrotransposon protein n=1 Tax=Cucumis melo var. makuwa TaxID=1194695 RepID=A0A5A7TI01_CUCMM|nr:retrotransposon protein [Cucumis melo var. makuwa]